MKNKLFFIFLMFISMTAFGQKESDLKSDTTKLPMTDEAIIFCTEFEKPIPSIKDFDLPPPPPNNLPALQIPDSIYILPDEMPTLAMFSHIENYEIRQDSSVREMLNFIYKNIKYSSRCASFEGTFVIGFIIEKDGTMTNVHIRKDIPNSLGLGEESLRVIKLLPKFSPAMKDGKAVRYLYYVPIRFRLD
jgi:hypothetical protein